jgi:hypothetical protein
MEVLLIQFTIFDPPKRIKSSDAVKSPTSTRKQFSHQYASSNLWSSSSGAFSYAPRAKTEEQSEDGKCSRADIGSVPASPNLS